MAFTTSLPTVLDALENVKAPIYAIPLTGQVVGDKGVKFISEPTLSSEKFAKVCFCIDPNNVRVELVEILLKPKN